MSVAKKVLAAIWVVLIALALIQSGTTAGNVAVKILAIMSVIHVIEMAVFFKVCKQAEGSLGGHLVKTFFFGVLHANELKAAQANR